MGRRRRRRRSVEFKASVIEECLRPGVSITAAALAHSQNANMLRRSVVEGEIRLELQRSGATDKIVWPASAARDCAAWLCDWPR